MNVRTDTNKDGKVSNFAKHYKTEEVVESHDPPHKKTVFIRVSKLNGRRLIQL